MTPDRIRTAVPTYEGRVLPRPDEEVVDQGLAFDLATLSRRDLLKALGLGAAAAGLTACGAGSVGSGSSSAAAAATTSAATSATTSAGSAATAATAADLTEIPEETAGPYPGDG